MISWDVSEPWGYTPTIDFFLLSELSQVGPHLLMCLLLVGPHVLSRHLSVGPFSFGVQRFYHCQRINGWRVFARLMLEVWDLKMTIDLAFCRGSVRWVRCQVKVTWSFFIGWCKEEINGASVACFWLAQIWLVVMCWWRLTGGLMCQRGHDLMKSMVGV